MTFFRSAEFIYFHSVLGLLQVANIVLFTLTVSSLVNHWRTTAHLLDVEAKLHFGVVLKLFLITGIHIMLRISFTLTSLFRNSMDW